VKIFIMVFIWKRFDPRIHNRQSIRMKGHDYCEPGLYFITISTYGKERLFGHICNGKMILNDFGRIAEEEWLRAPVIRPNVFIDAYVIMPDHFHGIIGIRPPTDSTDPPGATPVIGATRRVAPTGKNGRPNGPEPGSIGAIVGQFKSQTTRRINILRFGATPVIGATRRVAPTGTVIRTVWQRDYYDRIIRGTRSLERVRRYIINNPSKYNPGRCI
jgi:putative transposase